MKRQNKAQTIAMMGMFSALIVLLAFTPIGYIQLPLIKATIIHVPVIIGSLVLGPQCGAVLGGLFGLTSLLNNTIAPTLSSFVFSPLIPTPITGEGSPWALLVCFAPRILVGVLPWFVYKGMQVLTKGKAEGVSLAVAGVAGSMTNTLLVMNLIFVFFKDSYAAIQNVALDAVYSVILGIIAANGIPEAIVAGVLTAVICGALKAAFRKKAVARL